METSIYGSTGPRRIWGGVRGAFEASSRVPAVLLLCVMVCEATLLLVKASRTPFWYDELLTVHVSALQPFSRVWSALAAGADGMPPGYYIAVRLARLLPIDAHVAARLPSVAGYLLALAGLYFFLKKRMSAAAGLLGALLLALSPFRGYGGEARGYAIMIGCFAVAAACWQRIPENRMMTPLFAAFAMIGVACHHLAVVTLLAFGAAELTWTVLSRRIRPGVWISMALAAAPFLWGLPILLHYREVYGQTFHSRPKWSTAFSTYGDYLDTYAVRALAVVLLLGLATGGALTRKLRQRELKEVPGDFTAPETVLALALLFYPSVLVTLTKLSGGGYTMRYGWPVALGLVLCAVRLFRAEVSRSVSAALLGAGLIAFAAQGADEARLLPPSNGSQDLRWAAVAELTRSEPEAPVVVGSGLAYLEAASYAPPDLRRRLTEIVDDKLAIRFVKTDTVDKTARQLAQFVDLRLEGPEEFCRAHRRFLVYSGWNNDWFTPYLMEKKYRLTALGRDNAKLSAWTLFLAEAPMEKDEQQ